MADERDTADDATRLTGIGGSDETRFADVAAAPRTAAPAAAAGARPGSSLSPGTLLGHTYRIDALLARGGMGEVYRARHAELDTEHAIKIILPELANDQRIVDLFRREAAVLRTIRHDAVVAYDGVFRDENGRLYLVMEFADGPSLSKLMRERTFGADEIRQLRDRLADGLAVAHEKGVIHRDISPDNVILCGGQVSQAKIIDFGISKLADPETKTIIGTDFAGKYSYVSPEQLGMFGGQIDGRSDIYSLGLVLVAAAQGEALDMGQSPISVIEARRSVPDLSRVPEAVRADLAAMLQPDPADRPQSMRALIGAGARQGTRPGKAATGADRPAGGRMRLVPVAAALAVLALVAGGGGYWYEYLRTTDETPAADSGQQPGGASTSTATTTGDSAAQTPATPVVGSTATTPPTADATDATQVTPAAAPSDMAVADSGQADATGADTASQPPTTVDTTSTDASAATPTTEPPPTTTAPDGGQPTDTQVALIPQALDLNRLRDDANRAVQGLSCAGVRIDAAASGDITASGYAGSEADRDKVARLLQGVPNVGRVENAVAVMPWPLCGAMDVVREQAAFNLGLPQGPGIDPGGANGVYREGDHLLISVTAPDVDGYLYLDYYDAAEKYVVHLLPNEIRPDNRVRAGQQVVIGTLPREQEKYRVSPPLGSNLLIAIASPEPLFDRSRPHVEPTSDEYLATLRSSLERARQGGSTGVAASSATLVFEERD
jgi:hypothetical protein